MSLLSEILSEEEEEEEEEEVFKVLGWNVLLRGLLCASVVCRAPPSASTFVVSE